MPATFFYCLAATVYMRKRFIIISFLVFLVGNVWSAETDLDTDLMQAIEDENKSLGSNLALKDSKSSTANVKELESMFIKVEAYFVAKGDAQDAVSLSKKSMELTAEIAKAITAKDFDSAINSATTLSRTCKTCHNFYKKS